MNGAFVKRWSIFIRERFSPVNYALLILSFLFGNGMLALRSAPKLIPSLSQVILTVMVAFLIFFHLRLFDERKDYETDLKLHPERPLARGVVKIQEVKILAWVVILFELSLSWLIGWQAFLGIILVVGFSLLMLKEFFVGSWLRPQMELYAITHTFVSIFMSLFVFSAFTSRYIWQIPLPGLVFAFDAWLIFTIFEFARKTYAAEEEKAGVDSYSKRLGRFGAVFAVFLMALASLVIVFYAGEMIGIASAYYYTLSLVLVLLVLAGLVYVLLPKAFFAILYRQTVNIYMLLFYLALGFVLLLKGRII
jgi:4-hydroxybenzoate polyprenyltransferase